MFIKGVCAQVVGVMVVVGAFMVLIGAVVMLVRPMGDVGFMGILVGVVIVVLLGNNGMIKIDGVDIGGGPSDNNSHQGCMFIVEFYNFDEGLYNA